MNTEQNPASVQANLLLQPEELAKHMEKLRKAFVDNPAVKGVELRSNLEPVMQHYLITGLSYRKLAEFLQKELPGCSYSRNVYVGYGDRWKLTPGNNLYNEKGAKAAERAKKQAASAARAEARAIAEVKARLEMNKAPLPDIIERLFKESATAPISRKLGWKEIRNGFCRHVIGDPLVEVRYCGNNTKGSYCTYHERIFYSPLDDWARRMKNEIHAGR